MTDQIVEWYRQMGISPVRQDIKDLGRHFTRREALYRQMGILPSSIRGRNILEVGPGSGFNSIYTASLAPARYVLLEGNPTGVADIKKLFSEFGELARPLEVRCALLQELDPKETFDIVFCEGMLSGVPDPAEVTKLLARHVAPGGLLVITCIDQISYFSETLRRICAALLVNPTDSLEVQTQKMLPAFSPHLAKLEGMSRSHEDWIVDSMINPTAIGPLLDIPAAIEAIQDNFDYFASSPHFVTEWRWYKKFGVEAANYNQSAIDQYWSLAHNFLNHTKLSGPRSPEKNRELFNVCREARLLIREYERTRDLALVKTIAGFIGQAADLTREFCKESAAAMDEVCALISHLPLDAKAVGNSPALSTLFGRAQQYVSFTRRA